ncbi:aminotransferase class IV [Natronobacterium gregoryi]|uniref:4-amino-4-deoxychorismate lyase n=2 Tax=Natronobacterium gregoryi TaxID=44930 RepID=L0AG89_NATGS|nr:aminotransferase class IV [Natronobacterium gregoryi]AFZ72157.1 branched-chain amino acid aminotransferase/4-amino-4-deoxychorismate lyase [Natronobacterium gregoryi SP2]ELY63070.1 aminodeoxychorismate lyase [Natronobacterium gregoryi SP2]PLK20104.1 4-amino-4-deoxychorismate lyase [Natronobacterium gregoryi SP2]SFJ33231.1 branched-chain amino acid aminotransferase [Natronobacterium gregoryi]
MTDEPLYHVDGTLVPASEATVSVDDRGFRYGDAAFETLRAYGGTVFEWEHHVERLEATCETLSLEHGLSTDALQGRIGETLAANDLADAYVRLSITRGVQPGKLTPQPEVDPTVIVYAKPLSRGGLEGESVWDESATVETVETRKIPDAALPASAKTHNYLNGILARTELSSDVDEAVLFDAANHVAEGTTSNLFFVRDGVLQTPSTDGPVLPGITREVVLELAEEAGVSTREGTYDLEDVLAADEVFLTNRTWELRPVATVDGREIGGGPVTDCLSRLYDERVEERCYG